MVIVRSPFADMKASPWEKEDAMHEDIPIIDNHVPKSFVIATDEEWSVVGGQWSAGMPVPENAGLNNGLLVADNPQSEIRNPKLRGVMF